MSPLPISAVSGTGTGELLDLVCTELKKREVYLPILDMQHFQWTHLVTHMIIRINLLDGNNTNVLMLEYRPW